MVVVLFLVRAHTDALETNGLSGAVECAVGKEECAGERVRLVVFAIDRDGILRADAMFPGSSQQDGGFVVTHVE